VLPNRDMGPWNALNPRAIWWLVVLVALVSFIGYFVIKIAGPRKGIGATAALGGLASSTATTLSFARMGRSQPDIADLLSAGVIVATSVMFGRVLVFGSALNASLLPELAPSLTAMGLTGLAIAYYLWKRADRNGAHHPLTLENPVAISRALKFAALFAAISLLAHGLREAFGHRGLYILAAVSGIADVDAITLNLSRMSLQSDDGVTPEVAARAITLATIVNCLVKAPIVWFLAGGAMGRRVLVAMLVTCVTGALIAVFV
jgi:uncharacterized membrane protein (DUF4010 family)